MESRYIDGVDAPAFDESVSDALEAAEHPLGGFSHQVAIENAEGQVYRVVTMGLGELVAAQEELALMDFTDVLTHSSDSTEGYDARFRPPVDT